MNHLVWRKSTSSGQGENCVEVASLPDGGRAVRDSKTLDGTRLTFPAREWRVFLDGVKAEESSEETQTSRR
ncbi:DUF397 domain-containing protein [Sphaerisporangium corydalis]|uniref:DUF397 domain-containing protein n=1 Tax=Sphaerisporangium corydalis TaxID=1441875 RepID=A0ABV9EA28_9ACTN|nr:DUF397 domain-containing protein [Sphaerisporangium corydalis]